MVLKLCRVIIAEVDNCVTVDLGQKTKSIKVLADINGTSYNVRWINDSYHDFFQSHTGKCFRR